MPLTVGGGVRTLEHIRQLLRAGSDKVAINSAAFEIPTLISDGAKMFGSQCIGVSIDAKKIDGKYQCFSHGGRKPTGRELEDWVRQVEDSGAGEILITSIERDGQMEGYDLEMIDLVARRGQIPVIAQGGCGSYEHMYQAIQQGAQAVAKFTELQRFPSITRDVALEVPADLPNANPFRWTSPDSRPTRPN